MPRRSRVRPIVMMGLLAAVAFASDGSASAPALVSDPIAQRVSDARPSEPPEHRRSPEASARTPQPSAATRDARISPDDAKPKRILAWLFLLMKGGARGAR